MISQTLVERYGGVLKEGELDSVPVIWDGEHVGVAFAVVGSIYPVVFR